jgi:hypothetical protein
VRGVLAACWPPPARGDDPAGPAISAVPHARRRAASR